MHLWKDIVKTALLGTSTVGKLPDQLMGALQQMGIDAERSERLEEQFLAATAAYSGFRRAGYTLTQTLDKLPYAVCEDDNLPACTPKAANYLAQILQNNQEEVLLEWLLVLKEMGQRVPEELLPDLLAFGAMHEKTRKTLLPVLGKRGAWLAQFNNRWAFAADNAGASPKEDVFLLGAAKERAEFLQKLRGSDPEAALQLVQKTWVEEDYQTRADFLKIMNIGLSMNDLSFLESALEDGRKEVRQEAAALLMMLPESSLVKRMEAELTQLIKLKKSAKNYSLEVELPEKLSNELKRDGVREHFKPLPDGKKANWLAQMVSLVPPSYWEKAWNLSPDDCLALAIEDDYRNVWWWGWATAAKRLNDSNWLLAMHRFLIDQKPSGKKGLHFSLDFLYRDLPNNLFNQLAWEYMQKDSNALLADDHPAMTLLLQEYQKWEDKLAMEVIIRIRKAIANDAGVFNWNQKTLLKRAAYAIHPALYPKMELGWPHELGYSWQNEVTNFLATLRFRKEIIELRTTTI